LPDLDGEAQGLVLCWVGGDDFTLIRKEGKAEEAIQIRVL
jgi:hypothetical protein